MEDSHSVPLHHCHVHKLRAALFKTYALVHILALGAIFYYRGAFFFNKTLLEPHNLVHPFPWFLIFAAEILLSFLWILKQPMYWRPVTRTAFPERLPKDEELPRIDVFICTTDPNKEPTFEVMNTVVSAMALDYPGEKLSVYLSDDGCASVTLEGMKEAWAFATWWLPFCRRYNVKTICPLAYFDQPEEESQSEEFIQDRNAVKVICLIKLVSLQTSKIHSF